MLIAHASIHVVPLLEVHCLLEGDLLLPFLFLLLIRLGVGFLIMAFTILVLQAADLMKYLFLK